MFLLEKPTPVDGCPSPEALAAFDCGQLSSVQTEELADHVAGCGTCNSALATLHTQSMQHEPLVGKLRHSFVPAHVTGQDFGPFVLTENIGEGGMGSVYKAWQRTLHRFVALKKLRPEICRDADMADRFRAEALAVAQLNHPHVVQVFDCSDVDGQPYLCMELMPGGSLADRIRGTPLPARDAALLVKKLALAMDAVHQQGLLHRDLKPSNIFLTSDDVPKIGDFGLARWADKNGKFSTNDGIVGSPSYMAPEQADQQSFQFGTPTDIYALGAILYEALTGRAPFIGSTKTEVLAAVRAELPIPPGKINDSVPPGLEAICLKCLRKLPDERYSSAAALAAELQDWLERDARAHTARRRWRNTLFATAAVLIAGAVFAAILYSRLRSPYHDPRDPDQPINDIQARLARGETVTLIGDGGGPAWSLLLIGGNASEAAVSDKDGYFTVKSSRLAVLQLVRDPQVDHYTIHAEIRQEEGQFAGGVGLAFGMSDYPLAGSNLHHLSYVWFDDVHDEANPPDKSAAGIARQQGNSLYLDSRLYAEGTPKPACDRTIQCVEQKQVFTPSHGRDASVWRTLVIDVAPSGVDVGWDNTSLFKFSSPEIEQQSTIALDRLRKDKHLGPLIFGITPRFAPRSPVGLYVQASAVSFKNVYIQPAVE